jgi:hypothetical protein
MLKIGLLRKTNIRDITIFSMHVQVICPGTKKPHPDSGCGLDALKAEIISPLVTAIDAVNNLAQGLMPEKIKSVLPAATRIQNALGLQDVQMMRSGSLFDFQCFVYLGNVHLLLLLQKTNDGDPHRVRNGAQFACSFFQLLGIQFLSCHTSMFFLVFKRSVYT